MSTKPGMPSDSISLEGLIAQRYPPREYALFFEVRDSTGYSGTGRTADALAMGLWPSRGLDFTGFEVKRSRNDWQRELADPTKSAPIQRFCHFWYVVTEKDIVRDGELPRTWGLLERVSPKKLKVVKEAPGLKPKPITPQFVASLLRNASEGAERKAQKLATALADATLERMKGDEERRLAHAKTSLESQLGFLKEFEAAAGVSVLSAHWHRYTPKQIGEAVRVVLDSQQIFGVLQSLENLHIEAKAVARKTREAIDELAKLGKETAA